MRNKRKDGIKNEDVNKNQDNCDTIDHSLKSKNIDLTKDNLDIIEKKIIESEPCDNEIKKIKGLKTISSRWYI